jgi:hypothetical protein
MLSEDPIIEDIREVISPKSATKLSASLLPIRQPPHLTQMRCQTTGFGMEET